MAAVIDPTVAKEAIKAFVDGHYYNNFALLGMHARAGGPPIVRAFLPWASRVDVIDSASGADVAELKKVDPAGFFSGEIHGRREAFPYRLRVSGPDWSTEIEDAYRFGLVLQPLDIHLLCEGNHLEAYNVMGAHHRTMDSVQGVSFAVWAPNARRVSVIGPFNRWDGRVHGMRLRQECGVWEIFIPGIGPGTLYKFEILGPDGALLPLKADPYAFQSEHALEAASVVADAAPHQWRDRDWMDHRRTELRERPFTTYEVHLGSWKRVPEEGNRYLTYREFADDLVPYVKDMGFTHIELLPISEHPFDGSWGYQPLGLFAPTSRFGTPEDFAYFVDRCHQEGIGVILDWVPGHFPTDAHGLAWFDGTHLYEHADPRQGRHMDWGTLIYNFGRREVANFLMASALFWLDRFHIDGLRIDAVASMLYLDYSRKQGEWVPNMYGGNENLEAVALIKRLNEQVHGRFPGATTIAEESTAWPMVSRPTYLGGLGFGFKWNMGWMHDTLRYMSKESIHRRFHHNDLTFGLLYAWHENFVLPLSHDEVVHGKGSILGKMPGDAWQQFANLRAYYAFMWTHPGKKLLFMGGEFGQGWEWNHDESLQWHLLDHPSHRGVQQLIRDLNWFVAALRPLHQKDFDPAGFQWIDASDTDNSVISYLRRGANPAEFTLTVCNFTPVPRQDYRIGVPVGGEYLELINTDAEVYGGSNVGNGGRVSAQEVPMHGQPYSLCLTLPPLATLVFAPEWLEGAR
jgi:1,4-alpha-glucan branching enzyme